MKKVKNSQGGLVFSTNRDLDFTPEEEIQETLAPSAQKLRVELDKKQRAGKSVTLITGFVGAEDDLKELGRSLKTLCGVGGSVKDGEILVQGDFREKCSVWLTCKGYKVKKI